MITLARPMMGEEEVAAAARVLRSGRLVLGPEVEAFEEELAARCGTGNAVAVSSGTAALHLALWALGVGPGDEVVVPALTFPAPAAAAMALGARPVLADVDPAAWNATAGAVRAALTPRTRAIVVVDQFGAPADWESLEALAAERGLPLVEDAACALGATYRGRPCGSFGRVATLSFHPRKVVTTGEGGALLTSDPALAARARALRDHGRGEGGRFVSFGLNLRLGAMQAAVGRCQLARLEDIVARRRLLAERYVALLGEAGGGSLGLAPQRAVAEAAPCYQTFAVLLPWSRVRTERRRGEVIEAMAALGVEISVASFSLARLEPFAGHSSGPPSRLKGADAVHLRGLALPLHPGMGDQDVQRVVASLELCLERDRAGGS